MFAISGALLAADKKQTLVTFVFFAVVTSVGGGTLRDLLISLAGLMGPMAVVGAAAAGFALRGLAIARGWSLPSYRG